MKLDRPVQQRQGIGLVVINRRIPARDDGSDDIIFASVAFARNVLLDRAHGHALVRDLMVLAPRRERGKEATVGMGGIGRNMAANFLEVQTVDAVTGLLDLGEPAFEAQEAHTATFETLRPVALGAAGDVTVTAAQCPAGGGAQIEGENGLGDGVSPYPVQI